jgi:hypothetical protein
VSGAVGDFGVQGAFPLTVFTLTTDPDTFVGGPEGDTVNGTAATLNPGDQLTGGGGNDVLALYGSGTPRVGQFSTLLVCRA